MFSWNHTIYKSILQFYFVQDEYTPLHQACFKGHTDVVELLIDYGADCHKICDVRSSIIVSLILWSSQLHKALD